MKGGIDISGMTLDTPLRELYGVGKKYEKYLSSNGLCTVHDLLFYFPRAYQNRGDVCEIASAPLDNMPHSFILTVACEPKNALIRKGMNILKFRAFDESGSVTVTYFNQSYLKDVFRTGAQFRFWGKISREKRTLCMNSPSYEPYVYEKPLPPLVAVYPLFSGVNQKYLTKLQREIYPYIKSMVTDFMPEETRQKNGLCTLTYALENIHFPENEEALKSAIRRLTFDELFIFALSLSRIKTVSEEKTAPLMQNSDISPFISMLPYSLTVAQEKAISEISLDMCRKNPVFESGDGKETNVPAKQFCPSGVDNSGISDFIKPMNRIIVGDVGSGKTVCAAASAYIVCKNGFQCALMAPTEILAMQHYQSLSPMLEKLGIRCDILTGSVSQKEKNAILLRLKSGETDFVIGTHALIQDRVVFENLGLVITDEQHRFGVMQRARLAEKSKSAHVLVMSATPIPRTLSLMIYGDLDISLIDEMPPGRKKVSTFVVDESYRGRLNGFVRKQVQNGNQVYIVCPAIEEKKDDIDNAADYDPFGFSYSSPTPHMKAATDYAENLKTVFPDLKVELIHGKMKAAEKDRIMSSFVKGDIDILVSTTVIEVGVDVPNATLMIVENAERFGLSQLHQLRGRVGRGKDKSYCILVSDSKSPSAMERLEIMHSVYDGYTIAEYDLKMRGPGEFFSNGGPIRQSGDNGLNMASSCSDTVLLNSAFESARELIPSLYLYPLLNDEVDKACKSKSNTIN